MSTKKERIAALSGWLLQNRQRLILQEVCNLAAVDLKTINKVMFNYDIPESDLKDLETVVQMIENGELQECLKPVK